MARSFKQHGTVVVPLAESPIPMVEVESVDNPAIFSETIAGEGNITGLSVYGKSTQDGTPRPGNPIPIVSAGDDGNVDVSVTGKNLLDISKMQQKTTNGITFSLESGGIKVSGTATANVDSPIFTFRLQPGTYISNINRTQFPWLSSVNYVVEKKDGSMRWLDADVAFTVLDEDIGKYFYFAVAKGKTVNEIIYPQLELGSVSTDYEPYTSQSLTVSTPNGLPGIPVTSGGNYTDVSGQQWVCDVKDYGTSKYTQMVGHIESYNDENITTPYMSTTGQLSTGAEVYYVLDEPVVTDISADELTAYRALHTYDGTTVISVNSDPIAPGVKTTVKVIDPNSGNPQIMRLWLDKEGHPVNINGRGARVGDTPAQQYILQPCSF